MSASMPFWLKWIPMLSDEEMAERLQAARDRLEEANTRVQAVKIWNPEGPP